MDSPKLSIIIPVFNVENYLAACIESIRKQSFKDYEIILVDDGSTDNSGKICDEFLLKDPRIKVFHQNNAGVSAARNFGLSKSEGKWICFVDGDDMIEENSLSFLINEAEQIGPELLIAKSFNYKDGVKVKVKYPFPDDFVGKVFTGCELIEERSYKFGSVCVGLFRKEFLEKNQIIFPADIESGEDSIFISLCYLYAGKIAFSKVEFYLVNTRLESASQTWDFAKILRKVNNLRFLNSYKGNRPHLSDQQVAIIDLARYGVVSSIFNQFYSCFSFKRFLVLRKQVRENLNGKIKTGRITLSQNKIGVLNFSLTLFCLMVLFLQLKRDKIPH